jgi:hypothetical protein
MLAECAAALGASCAFTWVDGAFLEGQGVKCWSGPGSLPLWLPLPDYAGFTARDTTPARNAGLRVRALSETARDTLAWLRGANGKIDGLTSEEERQTLAAWHAREQRV